LFVEGVLSGRKDGVEDIFGVSISFFEVLKVAEFLLFVFGSSLAGGDEDSGGVFDEAFVLRDVGCHFEKSILYFMFIFFKTDDLLIIKRLSDLRKILVYVRYSTLRTYKFYSSDLSKIHSISIYILIFYIYLLFT